MKSYRLDANRNVVEADLLDMMDDILNFGDPTATVGSTEVLVGITVSTRFLGVELNSWRKDGPPSTFETAVCTDEGTDVRRRYATWDEAARGHDEVCAEVLDEKLKELK